MDEKEMRARGFSDADIAYLKRYQQQQQRQQQTQESPTQRPPKAPQVPRNAWEFVKNLFQNGTLY